MNATQTRLEYLRRELRAERISYGELAELQGLAEFIEPGDVELLEAAGVPEFGPESDSPATLDVPPTPDIAALESAAESLSRSGDLVNAIALWSIILRLRTEAQ